MNNILKKTIGGVRMGEIYATSAGLNTMSDLSEEQRDKVNKWVKEAEETVAKTQLEEDARISINQSITKIQPILEEFMLAINTTIGNYEDANKGLSSTIDKIESERVG